jgi:hypothetical protein
MLLDTFLPLIRYLRLILLRLPGAKLDKLRADLQDRVAELNDDEEDVESEIARLLEKKKEIRNRRLLLRAEYGSLTKREKETMARELSSIEELSRLEDQAGLSVTSASDEPVVPDVLSPPAGWLEDLPDDWTISQLLGSVGGTVVGGPGSS